MIIDDWSARFPKTVIGFCPGVMICAWSWMEDAAVLALVPERHRQPGWELQEADDVAEQSFTDATQKALAVSHEHMSLALQPTTSSIPQPDVGFGMHVALAHAHDMSEMQLVTELLYWEHQVVQSVCHLDPIVVALQYCIRVRGVGHAAPPLGKTRTVRDWYWTAEVPHDALQGDHGPQSLVTQSTPRGRHCPKNSVAMKGFQKQVASSLHTSGSVYWHTRSVHLP